MRYLCLFYKVVSTKLAAKLTSTKLTSMILFLQSDNLTDIQTHVSLSLAELRILRNHIFLALLVNGTS